MWFRSFVDKVIGKPHLKSQKPPKRKENSISAYPPPWIKTLGKKKPMDGHGWIRTIPFFFLSKLIERNS